MPQNEGPPQIAFVGLRELIFPVELGALPEGLVRLSIGLHQGEPAIRSCGSTCCLRRLVPQKGSLLTVTGSRSTTTITWTACPVFFNENPLESSSASDLYRARNANGFWKSPRRGLKKASVAGRGRPRPRKTVLC